MRILYGVQGTGNGHITRARVMDKALCDAGVEVDYLFSGRPAEAYFDMARFRRKRFEKGLTFQIKNGRIKYLQTAFTNSPLAFRKVIRQLDLSPYDHILTDFEPVTAWAAKAAGIPCIGIGHQYVFTHPVPQTKPHFLSQLVYKHFAPAAKNLPLHWHHFNAPILPPIIEPHGDAHPMLQKYVLVYLPLESQRRMIKLLAPFNDHHFLIYTPEPITSHHPHITIKALSRSGFQNDLNTCDAVIANAGFELSSEALSLGKRLLVRPLKGQSEQQSNALALTHLGYGHSCQYFSHDQIDEFLRSDWRVQLTYPDVSAHIVNWLIKGQHKRDQNWYDQLWDQVKVLH